MFINSYLTKRLMVESIEKAIEYYKKAVYVDPKYRDIRYFMSLLIRLPQIDQHLFSLIYFRKQAVQSFAYTIKFPDEYQATETEKKQLLEIQERFSSSGLHSLIDTTMNGRLNGMSAAQLNWEHSDNRKHFVSSVKSLQLTELDYDLENDTSLIHIDTDTNTQKWKEKTLTIVQHIAFVLTQCPVSKMTFRRLSKN